MLASFFLIHTWLYGMRKSYIISIVKIQVGDLMLEERLKQLNLPELFKLDDGSMVKSVDDWSIRRKEIMNVILNEEYGLIPDRPDNVYVKEVRRIYNDFAGKGEHLVYDVCFNADKGEFSFPVNVVKPKGKEKRPAVVHIAFRPDIPDKYYPAEEVLDLGLTVFTFCYQDVTTDNDDFGNGLASMYDRSKWTWGKIAMWAFAAMRVCDLLHTLDYVDTENIAVIGHSRLGKTALLAGALDERFKYIISNNSGCSGAAISRDKKGETIKDICSRFGYWFCENYKKYMDNEDNMPFDQHYLLSLICPRYLYVSSAIQDTWADPYNEFITLKAIDKVYDLHGVSGFACENRLPRPGDVFAEGRVGYHLREGTHYVSRYDWIRFADFLKKGDR